MSKPLRLAMVLAVFGGLAAVVALGEGLTILDTLIGFGLWFVIGYGIGVLIWGRSEKARRRAKIGARSASSYLSEIPASAPLPEQLDHLSELRSSRKISEGDYAAAKATLIGPASVPLTKSQRGRYVDGRWL